MHGWHARGRVLRVFHVVRHGWVVEGRSLDESVSSSNDGWKQLVDPVGEGASIDEQHCSRTKKKRMNESKRRSRHHGDEASPGSYGTVASLKPWKRRRSLDSRDGSGGGRKEGGMGGRARYRYSRRKTRGLFTWRLWLSNEAFLHPACGLARGPE